MAQLILIVIFIMAVIKPDLMIGKEYKEKATEEQKEKLYKNARITYGSFAGFFAGESIFLLMDSSLLTLVFTIGFFVLLFTTIIPAMKETSQITKELKNQ